jgi:PEGA domain-containing protein
VFTVERRDRSSRPRARSGRGGSLICALSLSLALPARSAWGQEGTHTRPGHAEPAGAAPAAAEHPAPAAAPPAPAAPARSKAPPGGGASLADSLSGGARADYDAARILYDDGDFVGALTKLESAFTASKDPRLLWNMAACEKAQRHYARMIDLLERYLADGATLIGADERQATRDLVATVQQFVNELRMEIEPEGARVLIDGAEVASAPLAKPLRVDMGKRQLRVEKAGFVPYATELDLAGGKSIELKVALAAEVHEGMLRIVADPSAVLSVDGHVMGTATWSGTLASGAHTVHVSATGKQPYHTEVVIKDGDTSTLHIALQDEQKNVLLRDQGSNNTIWWVVGGVALAGAGVGTYFLLRPEDEPRQPESGTWGLFDLP